MVDLCTSHQPLRCFISSESSHLLSVLRHQGFQLRLGWDGTTRQGLQPEGVAGDLVPRQPAGRVLAQHAVYQPLQLRARICVSRLVKRKGGVLVSIWICMRGVSLQPAWKGLSSIASTNGFFLASIAHCSGVPA